MRPIQFFEHFFNAFPNWRLPLIHTEDRGSWSHEDCQLLRDAHFEQRHVCRKTDVTYVCSWIIKLLTMLDPTQHRKQHEKIRDAWPGFPEGLRLRCNFGSWGLQTFTWRMLRSWSTSTALLRGSLVAAVAMGLSSICQFLGHLGFRWSVIFRIWLFLWR